MLGLITNRTAANVERAKELNAKGWQNMTASEKAEWLGDPLDAVTNGYTSPVNIIPTDYVSKGATLEFRNGSVTATGDGYAVIIIGDAAKFEGKTLTLSADEINTINGGMPLVELVWYDDSGFLSAGIAMREAGSDTLDLEDNSEGKSYLAMYIYADGGTVRYSGLMLEIGRVRHAYVPYRQVVPTRATKGAYNFSDLNRVEMAVSEISEILGLNLVTKTNWGRWDVPNDSDMERYLGNVKRIRDASPIGGEMPILPIRMADLNFEVANNIETILEAAYEAVKTIPRSGELYCGEV